MIWQWRIEFASHPWHSKPLISGVYFFIYVPGISPLGSRAPCGARRGNVKRLKRKQRNLNPRAPCGARHSRWNFFLCLTMAFQSTCPLRGTTSLDYIYIIACCISIHVPLAGHDLQILLLHPLQTISIHVPLAGHDVTNPSSSSLANDFNPRAPCGARLQKGTKITVHFCENRLDLRFSAGSAACQEQNRS